MDRANEASLAEAAADPREGLHAPVSLLTPPPIGQVLGLTPLQRTCKRIFDIVTAIAIFGLFWWAILGVALVLRLSTGRPVIFSHRRVGRWDRDFECYKFRSMVPDAEAVLADLLQKDLEARAEWERDFKLKDDPRITPFGRFIRRTSLDEFPQLWNVIRGDMSIVGPRPVVRKELDYYYADAREHYLAVKPGLTGAWQTSGRNDMEYSERVALDRAYVESWSLWSDFVIVMRTASAILARRGAY